MNSEKNKPTLSVMFSTDTFITPFRKHFSDNFKVSWRPIPYTPPPKSVFEFLTFPFRLLSKKLKTFNYSRGSEILFVEFADETLALVSKIRKNKMIVTRLHRYELFKLPKADWSVIDIVIVVNNWMKEELELKVPSLKGKIICIHNFVDVNFWNKPTRRKINNKLSIVGNIEKRKGHDKAIVAFSKLLKKRDNLQLSIIGKSKDQSFSDSLNVLVSDLGLNDNVLFNGYVDDLRKEFHETDVILSFSEHESTHLTLFEGLSCGAFPLSRNWEGVEEFLPKNNIFSTDSEFVTKIDKFYSNGLSSNSSEIESLASSILPKFSDPDPRKLLSDLILEKYLNSK